MDALQTAEQHNDLGNSLKRAGKVTEAIGHYREALRLKPRWADAHNNLGLALRALGDLPAALEQFRLAVRVRADHLEARNNLGVTLSDLGQLAEAAATYRLVLKHRPGAADTHNNLGVVLVQRGTRTEAIVHYRRALEIRPNYAEAHNNLGNALRHEGKFEDAEACLREALRLRPEYAEAHNNLAIILMKQERVEEAIANYRQALRMKEDYRDAHKNLGLALLGKEEYREGWKEYAFRWGTKEMPARTFDRPAWDGGTLDGKTILLYAEQGLGDTLQFIRCAAPVAERGGKVVVECQKPLLGIFGRCRGIDRLVAQGEKLPAFDMHAPLMSVPGIVGQDADPAITGTMEIVPHEPPYLSADPERIRRWGEELKGLTGYKIGIAWQGNRGFQDDQFRSMPLKHFEPLAKLAGARLISLQKGYGSEQLRQAGGWNVLDIGNRLDDFLDTAAVMKHLDLVICVDTAVAHLAGALGVPVWVALSTAPDWRWMHQRDDSLWYPSARLFRQKQWGDWAEVFERIARALRPTQVAVPIVAEIAPGELLARIAILEIERSRICDERRLDNIRAELGGLVATRARCLRPSAALASLTAQLKVVNENLWQIEDDKRLHEQRKDFGDHFVELARSV